jgi:SET and MYND domain-containing protein 4
VTYKRILSLVTHQASTHIEDLIKYTLTSIVLAHFYTLKSKESDIILIASLILHHLLQSICNAHAITQIRSDHNINNNEAVYSTEEIRYATAIYPIVSMLNHSCDPNVMSSFKYNSSRIIIMSNRKIDSTLNSNEILNCYGPHHSKMNTPTRQRALEQQYHFKCQCQRCLQPNDFTFNKKSPFRCLNCHSMTQHVLSKSTKISLKCLECCQLFDNFQVYLNKLYQLEDQLIDAVQSNNLKKCQDIVTKYENELLIISNDDSNCKIEIYSNFYKSYGNSLDALSKLNCHFGRFKEAAQLTRKSIKILKIIYNDDNSGCSVEIVHELLKLAQILFNGGEVEESLKVANECLLKGQLVYNKDDEILNEIEHFLNNLRNIF